MRVNSNTPNAARPWFCAKLSASRLDDVPISVHTPPICAAYAIGISTRAGEVPVRSHTRRASGRKVATSAMFLTNAPSGAIASIIAKVSSQGRRIFISSRISGSSTPERSMPRLSANIAATVTVASLLKPDSASTGLTMPSTTRAASTISATRSMRTFSLTNIAMAATMIATVAQACQLMRPAPWRGDACALAGSPKGVPLA